MPLMRSSYEAGFLDTRILSRTAQPLPVRTFVDPRALFSVREVDVLRTVSRRHGMLAMLLGDALVAAGFAWRGGVGDKDG